MLKNKITRIRNRMLKKKMNPSVVTKLLLKQVKNGKLPKDALFYIRDRENIAKEWVTYSKAVFGKL